jgi:hypothetical protein
MDLDKIKSQFWEDIEKGRTQALGFKELVERYVKTGESMKTDEARPPIGWLREKMAEMPNIAEIQEKDMTEEEMEREKKRINLSGNTNLARYARAFRSMRKFVQFRGKGGRPK